MSPRNRQAGFALIVSLSIMAILVLTAVSLFSLSSVAIRSAEIASAQAKAQANAKMALMLAMGELQKLAGPDTRITAPADIYDKNNPSLVGVWRSWEGSDHETSSTASGRPIAPNYGSKTQPEESGGRFVGWLVSGAPELTADPGEADNLVSKTATSGSVPILAEGTLGAGSNREVHIVPADLAGKGGYAWWASGENQKALLPKPLDSNDPNYPDSIAEWSDVVKSNGTADPSVFGLDSLFSDPSIVEKVANRETMALLGSEDDLGASFHDLTPYSVGLLTNVATGGWKKDLSLFSERTDQENLDLPLFRLTPTQTISYNWPTTRAPTPQASLLYPWADYRDDDTLAFGKTGAVSSWANMVDWATHYKRTTNQGNGVFSTPLVYTNLKRSNSADIYQYLHTARMMPLIARIQWVLSYDAVPDPNPPAGASNHYYPRIIFTPAVTMWNPYNVAVTIPDKYTMYFNASLPVALKFGFNGAYNDNYQSVVSEFNPSTQYGIPLKGRNINASGKKVGGQTLYKVRNALDFPMVFSPGEALLFSPDFEAINPNSIIGGGGIEGNPYQPGLRLDAGWLLGIDTQTGGNTFEWQSYPAGTIISVQAVFDNLNNAGGSGIVFDSFLSGQLTTRHHTVFTEEVAGIVNPPLPDGDIASIILSSAAASPRPFMSLVYGPRVSSINNHLGSKGFVQSNPFTMNVAGGNVDDDILGHNYPGADHPVNIHYDFSAMTHSTSGDSEYPNVTSDGNGFIISGTTSGTGLTRGIIAQLPVRPLASLVELTNWDMRMENPIPPFAFNLIGNSDASPLIPSDSVYNPSNSVKGAEDLQHDDSYCANHLLFDDWFASSIAPDPAPANSRSQEEVYTDFLLDDKPLQNKSYKPTQKDRASAEAGNAASLFNQEVTTGEAWQTIASRLVVEGMFNVNSTSEKAWQALLGHAREIRVPYHETKDSIGLSDEVDYAFSRSPVAADGATDATGTSGGFPEAAEFTGYRVFDERFLESLAEKIVEQVRLRGPFLSLAEFMNRQLSSGNLALAGALQTALNEVARSNSTFATLEALSGESVSAPPGDPDYEYPDAAVGSSAYGMPGWTRQADILRPIAPILTARDDTFTIRTYGDVRDQSGTITAKAYCEAVVRRTRNYMDPADAADSTLHPQSIINQKFGRQFEVVSFRWLKAEEV